MKQEIHVLILEDLPADAELVLRELHQEGFQATSTRVMTEPDFLVALRNPAPDLILADYALPTFDGLSALAIAKKECPNVPVILVSGTLGEEMAIDALHQGATDYVLKQRLSRLGPAVRRALLETQQRRDHERALEQVFGLNLLLRAIRGITQLIVRERDPRRLLANACDILVQTRGYLFVWVGLTEPDSQRVVRAGDAGKGAGYLDEITVTWDETPTGLGPVGTAIRTGEPWVCQDTAADPRFALWKGRALAHGFASVAAVPMMQGTRALGALAVYSDRTDVFVEDEVRLLNELAADMAYALRSIEDENERKRAEEELRDANQFNRQIIAWAQEGIVVYGTDLKYQVWNPYMEQLTGLPAAEVLGRDPVEVFPFLRENGVLQVLERARLGETHSAEFAFHDHRTHANGWTADTSGPLRNLRGEVIGVIGIVRDITARKRAEEALRQREEYFRALIENASDIISVLAPDGTIRYESPSVERILGYRPDELFGRDCFALVHPEDVSKIQAVFAVATGGPLSVVSEELRLRHQDGSWRIFESIARNLITDPNVKGIVVNSRDVTNKRLAETAQRDAESLYHSLVEHLPQCVFRKDREGKFTYVNNQFCTLMAKTPDELLGKTVFDLLPRALAEKLRRDDQTVMRTQKVFEVIEEHLSTANPKTVLHVLKAPVRNALGECIGVQGILTDITNQRSLEAQLLRAQRIEGIGSLASGIAHDLNNVLSPILMCVPLLRTETKTEERRQMLGIIESSVGRAVEIVKQLLSFGRGGEDAQTPLQPRHLVRDMTRIARETFPRAIAIHAEIPHDLWLVKGNATQLHQVLLNLTINARDAMPAGGTLTLRGENIQLDDYFASMHPQAKPGPFVLLQVQDTGAGIPAEIRSRIFDPFFTTKAQDQGTGLGLTTTLGIVKNHGGLILVRSEVNHGTQFDIYLPATPDARIEARDHPANLPIPAGRGELILIVDDEATICQTAERTLRQHGYEVLTAKDGIEAIGLFAGHAKQVSALVTDLMMPLMDGVALCRVVRKIDPNMRIIVCTGVGSDPASEAAVVALGQLKIDRILSKPHTGETLLRALHSVLTGTED